MKTKLRKDEIAVATVLLQAGKTVKEIAKFAGLDADGVRGVARDLDLEPSGKAQQRAKELYGSSDGMAYKDIAAALAGEGFTAEGGSPMHHLTVASWARDHGWSWGGSADGEYAPQNTAASAAKARYSLRLTKERDAEVNSPKAVRAAAEAAWVELSGDATRIVQLAVIRGAASAGVTDIAGVRKVLLDAHGAEIRSARA